MCIYIYIYIYIYPSASQTRHRAWHWPVIIRGRFLLHFWINAEQESTTFWDASSNLRSRFWYHWVVLWVLRDALETLPARPGDPFWPNAQKERKKTRNESPVGGLRVEYSSFGGPFWGAFLYISLKIDVFLSDVFQIGFFIDFWPLRDLPKP